MQSRIRYVTHKGQRVLHCDFTNIQDPQEGLRLIPLADAEVAKAEKNSLLILIDIEGSKFDSVLKEAVARSAEFQKPYQRATALVGVKGMGRVIYSFVSRMTGRREPMFEDVPSALDWLVSQAPVTAKV